MEQLELDFRKWKPIEGYEGLYDLRDDGLIYSHPRPYCDGGYTYGSYNSDGYLQKVLSKNGNIKYKRVNILVWETFVGPIPEGYDVHHINHNREDNRVENLELIEKHKHSKMHYNEREKIFRKQCVESRSIPILQFDRQNNLIAEYPSISEASRQTGIHLSNIAECCKGKRKSAGGCIWKYKEVV